MNSRTHRGSARLQIILLLSAVAAAIHVAFAQLTMTEVVTPDLGTVLSGASGRQFILNTDGTVTGANAADYLFGAVSGQLDLTWGAKGKVRINIVAENITTIGGVTVNAVPCRWHKQGQNTCEGGGLDRNLRNTRTLWVGVDLSTTQIHVGGDTASVTYDITVTFL